MGFTSPYLPAFLYLSDFLFDFEDFLSAAGTNGAINSSILKSGNAWLTGAGATPKAHPEPSALPEMGDWKPSRVPMDELLRARVSTCYR